MKIKLSFLSALLFLCSVLIAQDVPDYRRDSYINDFANTMSPDQQAQLDQKIRSFKDKSSIQMTVVSIQTLNGSDIESYANLLFNRWGIGTKELNNGMLILYSVSDHKWRIEVGTGLEEYITDGYAKNTGQNLLVPNFKRGDYFQGVNSLLDNFISTLGPISWDERKALEAKKKKDAEIAAQEFHDNFVTFLIWFLAFGIATAGVVIYVIRNKRKKQEEEDRKNALIKKINSLTNENNVKINDFLKLYNWALVNRNCFLDSYDSLIVECKKIKGELEDIYNRRLSEVEYLVTESNTIDKLSTPIIKKIKPIFNAAAEFENLKKSILAYKSTLSGITDKITRTAEIHKSHLATYGSSIVDMAFPKSKFDSSIKGALTTLRTLSDFDTKTIANMEEMKSSFKVIQAIGSDVQNHVNSVSTRLDSITNAVQFINANKNRVRSIVSDAERKVANSDVSSSTRQRFRTIKNKAELFKEESNPLITYNLLSTLINDLNSVIRSADDDINEAERARRRKIEEARIAKAAYSASQTSYSSNSDYSSSSSSSSSFGGFDGGSSSGGGASGNW